MTADPEELARRALADGTEEQALPILEQAARTARTDARLWQWTGLLHRALDRHEEACAAFGRAAELAPDDGGIAHGLARVALEAGLESAALFERAARLAPANGEVVLGLMAARFAAGDGDQAADDLAALLERNPLWIPGHGQLAQLLSMTGRGDQAAVSYERGLARHPRELSLWEGLLGMLLAAERYAMLAEAARKGRELAGPGPLFDVHEAIALAELGEQPREELLPGVWRVRHLLRHGRLGEALPLIDALLASAEATAAWPYAATAWRMAGDPRWQWLEGDPRLVSVVDLRPDLPPLDRLAGLLRSLHRAKGEYLDQSVRGGTQTDGPLLSRIEPEIRQLRAAIVGAVRRHVAQLSDPDPRHPTLCHRRDRPIRFAGSWSVRLRGQGRHANHVHPQGWLSSALYIALPERRPEDPDEAGWFTLGEPQAALGVPLPPFRTIEPRPGHLVLFPSTMWHGTIPFASGERLTVAFDVAPPR